MNVVSDHVDIPQCHEYQQEPLASVSTLALSSSPDTPWEDMIKMSIDFSVKSWQETREAIQDLGNQVTQLAAQVNEKEIPTQHSSSSKDVNVITLRSGKELPQRILPPVDEPPLKEIEEAESSSPKSPTWVTFDPPIFPNTDIPKAPFPSKLSKRKEKVIDQGLLDIFKRVEVNIPLLDAVKQIPRYAKFLKELCTNKRRPKEKERVVVSKNV